MSPLSLITRRPMIALQRCPTLPWQQTPAHQVLVRLPGGLAALGNGKTKNPGLVSVERDRDRLLYEFDEPLTGDDIIQNTGGLRIYFAKSDSGSIREAGAISVKRRDQTTLDAFFGRDLPGDRTLEDAAGAFVKQGAVQAAGGSRGGNDSKNTFDELSPTD